MEPPRKPSIVPILIGLAVGTAVLAGGGWLLFRKLTAEILAAPSIPAMPLPAELKEPRVLLAAEDISKREFAHVKDLGLITDMRLLGGDLILAGDLGTARADEQGRTKGEPVRYPVNGVSSVKIVPLNGGPDYDLFTVSRVMNGPALMDRSGKVLWSTPRTVESAAAGDLDGHGAPSIALGYIAGEGIELLDAKGKSRWKAPGSNPWDMQIIDGVPGAPPRVVYSNSKGDLTLRDAAGKSSSLSIKGYIDYILPTRWPGASGKPALLFGGVDGVFALGLDGKILGSLSTPLPSKRVTADMPVAVCRFVSKSGREYLAMTVRPRPFEERSALYVYDSAGKLVYAELLGQPAGALLAIPRPGRPGAQTLLVGGADSVFSYEL